MQNFIFEILACARICCGESSPDASEEPAKILFQLMLNLWGEQDSNLRRRSQQIYSLPSLAA